MLLICIFPLDYEYTNDLIFSENFMYGKNLVLEFCLKNYLGHSDCSSFRHRISPKWLECLTSFLRGHLASRVEPNG